MADDPVVVFGSDGDFVLLRSPREAAAWLEPIDVGEGECRAVLSLDGRSWPVRVVAGHVEVAASRPAGVEELRRVLAEYGQHPGPGAAGLRAWAEAVWDEQWRRSFPGRPRWLAGVPTPLFDNYGDRSWWRNR